MTFSKMKSRLLSTTAAHTVTALIIQVWLWAGVKKGFIFFFLNHNKLIIY